MSDVQQGWGWWQASDGKWYPPESHPQYQGAPPVAGYPGQFGHPVHPQQAWGGYPYPARRGTNGMAIAAMVLGILWLWWIGSVLALIFGYVARGQIKARNEAGDGMAIAGIVLGWIGVATGILTIVLVAVNAGHHGS